MLTLRKILLLYLRILFCTKRKGTSSDLEDEEIKRFKEEDITKKKYRNYIIRFNKIY